MSYELTHHEEEDAVDEWFFAEMKKLYDEGYPPHKVTDLIDEKNRKISALKDRYKDVFKSTELPPGCYYIGDPCYVIGEGKGFNKWHHFLNNTCHHKDVKSDYHHEFVYNGHKLFMHSTHWGDGGYVLRDSTIVGQRSNQVADLSVDSGMIGCIPIHLVDRDDGHGYNNLFHNNFKCSYEKGTFHIGKYVILTA